MKDKILIIDDEKIIREGIKKLLELDDYEALTAENGKQGLEILEANNNHKDMDIKVIILDVRMPGMDGIEVLKEIKERFPKTEVIIITGHGAVESAVQALRLGCFDFINKPIQYEELYLTILRALEKQEIVKKRQEAEDALRLSEEKYRTVVEHANDGIAIIQNGKFKYINRRLAEILCYDICELLETLVINYIHQNNVVPFIDYSNICMSGKLETVFLKKNGELVHIELNTGMIVYNDKPGYLVIFRDITDRKKSEEKIRYLSFHDSLTGLYNRAYFEEEMKRIDTDRQLPLSIIMGDVNGLKLVNDAFGHHVGDDLLKAAAECIIKSCRKEDIISRWGGDEFVILLPNVSEEKVQCMCDRIRSNFKKYNSLPIEISIALGEATKIDQSLKINEVLKEAEEKMYRSKLMSGKSVRSSIISSLEKTLRAKSFETEQHSSRMQKLCESFGILMKLSRSKIDELVLLAALHDIGKVAVPDEVLAKAGKLSDQEMNLVKKHPEIGYRIAKSCLEISHVAEAILAHHERWDGTGYPKGLKEKDIPLESRIISIIDAYDVMVNNRPYKKMISSSEALEELRICAGSQFDPYLVDAFVKMMYSNNLELEI